jgi:hypothetical protein
MELLRMSTELSRATNPISWIHVMCAAFRLPPAAHNRGLLRASPMQISMSLEASAYPDDLNRGPLTARLRRHPAFVESGSGPVRRECLHPGQDGPHSLGPCESLGRCHIRLRVAAAEVLALRLAAARVSWCTR